ncbi:MAG: phenylalanine--tRNA ligase subunit alpha [Deltaproteobacteria bacterium]|nr:MAG: phenylalanine--tRNA ligase subunit alpha [Deltaproteobacteria bacterium]
MSAQELIAQLEALGGEFAAAIADLTDEQAIRAAQARFLGKKGRVSAVMKQMGALPPDARREVGQVANRVKAAITDEVARRLAQLDALARQRDLERRVDVTLPGRQPHAGHAHIVWQVRDELIAIFAELGFDVAEGPQVETDFHNFEALAMPKDHPARDMQDTFYVTDDVVLRTHTSPVQIRTMLAQPPPVKIISPGIVFRRDDDPTHSPMFAQLEALLVDEVVRFSDLKGVLLHMVRRFFRRDLDVRFRPSYFPFVEPGAEVDMECSFCTPDTAADCRICKGTRWLEIGGCGMVDPDVFAHVGYDAERYTGFAFGMGIDRMAMLRHGINDIKLLYDGDVRFLRQF